MGVVWWRYPLGALLGTASGAGLSLLGWGLLLNLASDAFWMGSVGFFLSAMATFMIIGGVIANGRTTAAGLLVGCVAVTALYFLIREPGLEVSWSAERDRPDTLRGKGAWATEGSVVRVRSDGVLAYSLNDGSVRWSFALPGARVACAMSTGAGEGIGLIAHAEEGQPCGQVTALDLATGEKLWQRRIALPAPSESGGFFSVLDINAEVALLPVKGALQAVDPQSGKTRWKAPAPSGCAFDASRSALVLTGNRLAVTYLCGRAGSRVAVLDAATGRRLWNTPLPTVGPVESTEVFSADPVVLRVKEAGERGRDRVLTFREGRRAGEIPVSGLDGVIGFGSRKLPLMPDTALQVRGQVLYAEVRSERESKYSLVAYGMDGRRLWSTPGKDVSIESFSVHPDEIAVLYGRNDYYNGRPTDDLNLLQLRTLDPATGETRRRFALSFELKDTDLLLLHRPGFTAVATEEAVSPVIAFHPAH